MVAGPSSTTSSCSARATTSCSTTTTFVSAATLTSLSLNGGTLIYLEDLGRAQSDAQQMKLAAMGRLFGPRPTTAPQLPPVRQLAAVAAIDPE